MAVIRFDTFLIISGVMVIALIWLPYLFSTIIIATRPVYDTTCTIKMETFPSYEVCQLVYADYAKPFCIMTNTTQVGDHCGVYTNDQLVPCYVEQSSLRHREPFFNKRDAKCAHDDECGLSNLLFQIAGYTTGAYAMLVIILLIYQVYQEETRHARQHQYELTSVV